MLTAILVVTRPGVAPQDAEAAGNGTYRAFVIGVTAAESTERPEAWVVFETTYTVDQWFYSYTVTVRSRAPVLTSHEAVLFGNSPTVDLTGGSTSCTTDSPSAVSSIPLRTHGVLLPDVELTMQPASHRWLWNVFCPVEAGSSLGLKWVDDEDTARWWVTFHQEEFSYSAGGYVITGFSAPPAGFDPGNCILARKSATQIKDLGPGGALPLKVREQFNIWIVTRENCLP